MPGALGIGFSQPGLKHNSSAFHASGRPCAEASTHQTQSVGSQQQLGCRPREKLHRPQTRRRRDQADDSLDKLRQLRSNLGRARELLDTLARREQRKAHMLVSFNAKIGFRTQSPNSAQILVSMVILFKPSRPQGPETAAWPGGNSAKPTCW